VLLVPQKGVPSGAGLAPTVVPAISVWPQETAVASSQLSLPGFWALASKAKKKKKVNASAKLTQRVKWIFMVRIIG
jgi:hypothetical protein